MSLWTATPARQPALDYTELNPDIIQKYYTHKEPTDIETGPLEYPKRQPDIQPLETPKIESDI